MCRAANDLGISDVGLAKVCKKMGIPRPERGHWAKLASGRKSPQPLLPIGNYPKTYTIVPDLSAEAYGAKRVRAAKPPKEIPQIAVPAELVDPHPWISRAKAEFDKRADQDNLIYVSGYELPSIHVSYEQSMRALRICDAFLKTCEQLGVKVWSAQAKMWASVDNEEFEVNFREERTRHQLSKQEQKLAAQSNAWLTRTTTFMDEPNGQLRFFMRKNEGHYGEYVKSLAELPTRPMEERVEDLVIALWRMAASLKHRREEDKLRKEKRAQEAEESRLRLEAERREDQRMDKFLAWAGRWQEVQRLQPFMDEFSAYVETLPTDHEARNVLKVAIKRLAGMDPLANGEIASYPDQTSMYFGLGRIFAPMDDSRTATDPHATLNRGHPNKVLIRR